MKQVPDRKKLRCDHRCKISTCLMVQAGLFNLTTASLALASTPLPNTRSAGLEMPTQHSVVPVEQGLYALNRLLIAAIDRNDVRSVRKLLRQGADPNTLVTPEDKRPWPTHVRIWNYDDPRSRVSALMRAVEWSVFPLLNPDRTEVVTALVEAGAEVNFRATYTSERMDRWDRAPYHTTPLIEAAYGNRRKMVKVLLAHQADVNATDEFGTTALIRTAENLDIGMTRKLLTLGARIDARDDDGETALARLLDCTSGEYHTGFVGSVAILPRPIPARRTMAALLLQYGALIHDKNKYGMTIMWLASAYTEYDKKLAQMLRLAAEKEEGKRP